MILGDRSGVNCEIHLVWSYLASLNIQDWKQTLLGDSYFSSNMEELPYESCPYSKCLHALQYSE